MNDSKIKVLLVEPEKYPKEIVIDDSLEAMQEVVGGDIEEYMPYDDDVAIICNEEGKMRGLRLTVQFMCRTMIRKRWLILSAANSLSVMHRLRVRVFRACRTI